MIVKVFFIFSSFGFFYFLGEVINMFYFSWKDSVEGGVIAY